jgi:hypothetical protein
MLLPSRYYTITNRERAELEGLSVGHRVYYVDIFHRNNHLLIRERVGTDTSTEERYSAATKQ